MFLWPAETKMFPFGTGTQHTLFPFRIPYILLNNWRWFSRNILRFFFLSGFSFTDTDNSQDSRGREGAVFYSSLALPPAHEHLDMYLQLYTWDDYPVFLIPTLVFTRLLLDEIYHLIKLLFDWLIDDVTLIFVCLLIDLILGFDIAIWHEKPVDSNSHRLLYFNCKQTD